MRKPGDEVSFSPQATNKSLLKFLIIISFRSVDSGFPYRSLFHILHSRNSARILQNVIMDTHGTTCRMYNCDSIADITVHNHVFLHPNAVSTQLSISSMTLLITQFSVVRYNLYMWSKHTCIMEHTIHISLSKTIHEQSRQGQTLHKDMHSLHKTSHTPYTSYNSTACYIPQCKRLPTNRSNI